VRLGAAPLDGLARKLADRGIPEQLLTLGKFATEHEFAIPWMQASYIMVANKKALSYLPGGADLNALSYDQFAGWAGTIEKKTGQRLLGFPAGAQGLMYRFFEGYLYPSYTGGLVVPFRSETAEAMWTQFAAAGNARLRHASARFPSWSLRTALQPSLVVRLGWPR